MSFRLEPDQTRHFVMPDLGPNCLNRISADNSSRVRVKSILSRASSIHKGLFLIDVCGELRIIFVTFMGFRVNL